jgi:uncharacterized protein (TIGR03089 family)
MRHRAAPDLATTAPVPVRQSGDGTPALLTFYDDATGERAELSAAALGMWAARTAWLLRDGCGLTDDARAAVLLPPHWQTAAVLLGTWSVGIPVSLRLAATAGLPSYWPGEDEPFDVSFVSARRLDDWLEDVPAARHRFVLGLAPDAAPMDEVPDGHRDHLAEVLRHLSHVPPYAAVLPTDAATPDGTSFAEFAVVARGIAERIGLGPGDRLLVDTAEHDHPLFWLLTPLLAGASVVLCANLDPARVTARSAAEGVTHVL